jgi:hypothetical protein
MILDSLQPDPVIDAVESVSLPQQPRDKIVVGKIRVERSNRRKKALPEKQYSKTETDQQLQ